MIEDVGEHIDSHQFGSLKGSSTTYCLLDLIHNWLSELDNPDWYLRACFLDLAIDTKALESVDAHKVLGATIQSNLKWNLHINEDVAKASKRLYILHVLKRGGVPPADLLKVYFALIRSVLEYCCPVWHNALPVKLSDSIERVQKRALRIIFPALHYQEALATTGCVSLHTRRMELCSKLFTKIKEPEFRLRHLVAPTRSQAHGRSLRNKDRPSLIINISSGDVPLCWWHVI